MRSYELFQSITVFKLFNRKEFLDMGNILEGVTQGWFRHKSKLKNGYIVPCNGEIPEYYQPFIINPNLYVEFINLDTNNPEKIIDFINKYGFLYNSPNILTDRYGKTDFYYKKLYPPINLDKSDKAWQNYIKRDDSVAYMAYKANKQLSFGSGIIENYKFEIQRMRIVVKFWEGVINKDIVKLLSAYKIFTNIYGQITEDSKVDKYKDNYDMLVNTLSYFLLKPLNEELSLTEPSILITGFGLSQGKYEFHKKWKSGDLLTIMYYMLYLDMTGGVKVIRKCDYINCDNYFVVTNDNKSRIHCMEGNCGVKKHANAYNKRKRNPDSADYNPVLVMNNNKLTSLRQYKNRALKGLNEFSSNEIEERYKKDMKKFQTLKRKADKGIIDISEYEKQLNNIINLFKKYTLRYK